MKNSLRIGEVSKRSGIGVETVRFYEREGLIAKPPRRSSGYRAYPADVVPRLAFIRHAKDLGFTLKEIGELLSLRVDPKASCSVVKKRAEAKLSGIEERIGSLRRMRGTLRTLVEACDERKPTSECPILGALDRGKR
jgi:MerR family mercuric resistance operon transcriptional regulator